MDNNKQRGRFFFVRFRNLFKIIVCGWGGGGGQKVKSFEEMFEILKMIM